MNFRTKGNKYEKVAAGYLRHLSYELVALNWCCRWGEIDIILFEDDTLVFVEVKYRKHNQFDIDEVLTPKKRFALKRSIFIYLKENDLFDKNWRFDLFYITDSVKNIGKLEYNHFRNILL